VQRREGTSPDLVWLAEEGDFARQLAEDVRAGLAATPKCLPPKYFYDERGCQLFAQITRLPEYYLTRAEEAILERVAGSVVEGVRPAELLEIGGGCSQKTRLLLSAMRDVGCGRRYLPVDFSPVALRQTAEFLRTVDPGLDVQGVLADFERHVRRLPAPEGRRLVAFLGSTIGNLDAPQRAAFLADVAAGLGPADRFLLGADLVKGKAVLDAAYDDASGVTAEFNRNVLRVVNRELDADFSVASFAHVAFFSPERSRIEMWLRATRACDVRVAALGIEARFAAGEGMMTEISCKFTRAALEAELRAAGLLVERWETDDEGRFALLLARRD
jgi:L-histidine N-alpha-methyltransferase